MAERTDERPPPPAAPPDASVAQPQQLRLRIHSASRLVHHDHDGPVDAYAHLTVRSGSETRARKTKVVRSASPEWDEEFAFDGVAHESTEVAVLVKSRNVLFFRDHRLGQVDFALRELDLPRGGQFTPPLTFPLVARSGGSSVGSLTFQLAWGRGEAPPERQPSAEFEHVEGGGDLLNASRSCGSARRPPSRPAAKDAEGLQREPPREGDYQLRVHVLEARDLAPRDAGGTSDPLVLVHCFGKRRYTSAKRKQNNPIWDERLVLEGARLTEKTLGAMQIEVHVCDADTAARSELIGRFAIDALSLYYRADHEYWRQWVALTAPQTSRRSGGGGIQGYLRLSLSLLGPADKAKLHENGERRSASEANSNILLPPTVPQKLAFLRAAVHSARDLVPPAKSLTSTVDAFVTLEYAGYSARTTVISSTVPVWLTEFWFPVFLPSLGEVLVLNIVDKQQFGANVRLGSLRLRTDEVFRGAPSGLRWHQLQDGDHAARQRARGLDRLWYGKLLLSLSLETPEPSAQLSEKLMQRKMPSSVREPPSARYELRAAVLAATGLDAHRKEACVELRIEHHVYRREMPLSCCGETGMHAARLLIGRTEKQPVRDGYASFLSDPNGQSNEEAAWPPGVLRKVKHHRPLDLPAESAQLPPVFLILESDGRKIGVARLHASSMVRDSFGDFTPQWVLLAPPDANEKPEQSGFFFPALLVSISLAPSTESTDEGGRGSLIDWVLGSSTNSQTASAEGVSEAPTPPPPLNPTRWPPSREMMPLRSTLRAYELRVHLFSGHELEAADSNGLLDAYVVVSLGGRCCAGSHHSGRTSIERQTCNPSWQETLRMQMWLPPLDLCPHATLQVWDDDFGSDELVGIAQLRLGEAYLHPSGTDGSLQSGETPRKVMVPIFPLAKYHDETQQLQLARVPTSRSAPSVSDCDLPKGASGMILLAYELLPLPSAPIADTGAVTVDRPAPSLTPLPSMQLTTRAFQLRLLVISIQGLTAAGCHDLVVSAIGVQSSFVEVVLDERAGPGSGVRWRTSSSANPSPSDPSFSEMLEQRLSLPVDSLDTSVLQVNVRESMFGGLHAPLLGVAHIHLEAALHGPREEAPQKGGSGRPAGGSVEITPPSCAAAGAESSGQEGFGPGDSKTALLMMSGGPVAKAGVVSSIRSYLSAYVERDTNSSSSATRASLREDLLVPLLTTETAADIEMGPRRGATAELEADETDEVRAERIAAVARELDYLEARAALVRDRLRTRKWRLSLKRGESDQLRRMASELNRHMEEKLDLLGKLEAALSGEYRPSYMVRRSRVAGPLEEVLDHSPFASFSIESGFADTRLHVGTLKALVRVTELGVPLPESEERLFRRAMSPSEFVVRVYVLRAFDLVPADESSPSDAYLRVSLGKARLSGRDRFVSNSDNPRFHQFFELHAKLPGCSRLRIEVMDRDDFGGLSDDLIGATEIDLEDRAFSETWQTNMQSKPPIENRPLFSPLSSLPQGTLQLWVDILRKEDVLQHPPIDISPPAEQQWQLRLICWKARDVPTQADSSGLLDLAVSCAYGAEPARETDTHLRAEGGMASWNWRFKYNVHLSPWSEDALWQVVRLQLYDKDVFSAHDCIGEARLPLQSWFRRLFRLRPFSAGPAYFKPDPREYIVDDENLDSFSDLFENILMRKARVVDKGATSAKSDEDHPYKFWLPLWNTQREKCGELLVSVQMVPADLISRLEAGDGRSQPNANPTLPPPSGRFTFSLNPLVMISRLLGPKLRTRYVAIFCTAICLMLLLSMLPILLVDLIEGALHLTIRRLG